MAQDPKDAVAAALRKALEKEAPEFARFPIVFERPRQPEHGDFSCTLALQLAKQLKRNPRDLAKSLAESTLTLTPSIAQWIERPDVAGPGFMNFRLKPHAKREIVARALAEGPDFGRGRPAQPEKIQVEFVSANPTGPLHVGHGRGAAYGASLAGLLEFAGHEVSREYYINDAGRQMDILALSVWLRYLQARGRVVPFPEDGYRGDYVRDIAARLADAHAVRFERELDVAELTATAPGGDEGLDLLVKAAKELLGEDWALVHRFALEEMLAEQRADLAEFRVEFDRWLAERSLFDSGAV